MTDSTSAQTPLAHTPLHALHLELGGKLVGFAGYEMPLQYRQGILQEHHHTRSAASLFDVSHMGQVRVSGAQATAALERVLPADLLGMAIGQQRYSLLPLDDGGTLDDVMVTRRQEDWLLVINASRKNEDWAHLQAHIGSACELELLGSQALLALQGPQAAQALQTLCPGVQDLAFMSGAWFSLAGQPCFITRSGYTGEDGYEISTPAACASQAARELLAQPGVAPAGLGARDTLRLEAGLCLYGQELDVSTSAVQASLNWVISPARRAAGARAGGYPGASVIDAQLAQGPDRRRIGLQGQERVPVRAGALLQDANGEVVGHVTSGTLSPTLQSVVAQAHVRSSHAALATPLWAKVRERLVPMQVCRMPFVPHRYHRPS